METSRSQQTIDHVIRDYVQPARQKGKRTIQIRVGNVQKELGWTNRAPSIFSTLGSKKFQKEAGVELIETQGGPASGGPSTTVRFHYRIVKASKVELNNAGPENKRPANGVAKDTSSFNCVSPNGAGLWKLFGVLREAYDELGGGEAYLEKERAELRFPAEDGFDLDETGRLTHSKAPK